MDLAAWPAAGQAQGGGGPALATITIDRQERRNAQTPHMWLALADIRRSLPGSVRVVVIRAEGAWFSPGLDLQGLAPEGIAGAPSFPEMARMPDDEADALIAAYQAGFDWSHDPAYVSVAAVQGHAVGAGFQLALGCDLRVLADDAQLTMAETGHGIVPDLGGTKPLVQAVGYARALEICATGRRVAAAEAAELGIAQLVVRRDELDAAVADLAAALLAAPADAVRETKALLLGAAMRTYAEQCGAERDAQVRRLRDLAGLGE
ncbi:MAG: enoyl-CoA hydratase/isomerase family protein [Frankiaceae bacterium]